ncbi:MAG TPA: cyclic nucleotide-binding domain-containing protein [Kofleriaceae bacterium]|jgi:CRP-like cAMP-binding protein
MGPSATDLRTIPLFEGFTDAELGEIGTLFVPVSSKPDVALFDVGEPATTFYLLTSGEVVLERPNDDVFRLRPPALIGELGALTGLSRSTRALVSAGAEVWALSAKGLQAHFVNHQELGVRFLANLLAVVADKVHRDQRRMADMRQNLISTQKELKRLRELVLETVETPLSAPVHDTLDRLITHNRRVNYRVEPPPSLPATMRLETGAAEVIDLSRTHVSVELPQGTNANEGEWISGVLSLAGTDVPISGRVQRATDGRLAIELDLLIDEFAGALEGYLTRAQLLDVLV